MCDLRATGAYLSPFFNSSPKLVHLKFAYREIEGKFMKKEAAFTMLEIIVVLIIVGVLIPVSVPNLQNMIKHAQVQDAKNNLLAVYTAQVSRFANDSTYYAPGCAVPNDFRAGLKINLSITNNINYCCENPNVAIPPLEDFFCLAQGDGFELRINNAQVLVPMNTTPYPACGGTSNPCCSGGVCT